MGIKVLLVDDNSSFLEHSRSLLKHIDERLEVDTALSTEEGLKLLSEVDYDAIVSDYRMPDKDGLSFLKEVRERSIDIPFLIFTIVGKDEIARKVYDAGADHFLEKGENLKDRLETLARVIEREVYDHRSKTKYEDLFYESTDLMIEMDKEGKIIDANPAFKDGLPKKDVEVKGKHVSEFFSKDVAEKMVDTGKLSMESGEKKELEYESMGGWYHSIFIPITNKDMRSFHVVIRDITHRKKIEEKLQRREERYRDLVEGSIVGVYVIQDNVFKYVNPEFCRMLGYEREDLTEKHYLNVVGSEDEDFIKKSIEKREKEGGMSRHVFKGSMKEGTEKFLEAHSVSTTYEGRPAIQGTLLDISARKEAQRKLKKSQERFKNLFQLTPDLVFMINSDGYFENVNDTFLEITGYDEEEIIGQYYGDLSFFSKESLETLREKLKEKERSRPFSFKIEPKKGTKKFLEVNMEDLTEEGEVVGHICIARDITEWKRLEDLSNGLLKSRELGLIVIKGGEIKETNPYFEEISGYSRDEVIGMDALDLLPSEERERVRRKAVEMLKGKRKEPYEHGVLKKDGKKGWVLEQVSPIHYEGERATLATFVDITERKEAVERQEFLHSLLRHDILNKNQVVQGYLQLLEERELEPSMERFVEKALSTIKESTEQIKKVRKLRDIDREEDLKDIDLNILLSTIIEKERMTTEDLGMKIRYQEKDIHVRGGDLLKELFSNLIENSIKHSGGSEIKVSVEEEGENVSVIIEDDGKGIPDHEKDRIFKRGYKGRDSSGSGLGMHLVEKITENYGGNIEVSDSKMGGALFKVYLQKV